jgi:hypothetical protein
MVHSLGLIMRGVDGSADGRLGTLTWPAFEDVDGSEWVGLSACMLVE